MISFVYGDAALSEVTYRDWFRRFKDGDFDVDASLREGWPKTFEDAELQALLDEDPYQTQEELALALGIPVFPRYCAVRLFLVPVDDKWTG